MEKNNIADLVIKSKNDKGFRQEEIDLIKESDLVDQVSLISSIDTTVMDVDARIYIYQLKNTSLNKINLIEGRMPNNSHEIVVEQKSETIEPHNLNEKIILYGIEYTICGIVQNPLNLYRNGDVSIITGEPLKLILYFDESNEVPPFPKTDILVSLNSTKDMSFFSKKYLEKVDDSVKKISNISEFSEQNVKILTLEENKSYAILTNICDKVDIIAAIFPIFFILVVALVILTTMSRLVDEDRIVIGCYKSLGYSNSRIILKYLIFFIACLVIGISLGLLFGAIILPNVVYPSFNSIFFLPSRTSTVSFILGIISSIFMIIAVLSVTLFVAIKELKEKPTELLKAKTPMAGRKILLEKVNCIWQRLSFKYKSCYRNIFRYKGRLFMIIISMCGCSALVMAGFGLFDVSNEVIIFEGIKISTGNTISFIAAVVIIFALFLSVLVLYNLTNMNICERSREIATLKVLGYLNREVYGYIFREILVMSIIGILIGIPLGVGLLYFIFDLLKFGSILNIKVISYFLTFGIILLFIFFVDILLIHKIKGIDMNDSLKSLE